MDEIIKELLSKIEDVANALKQYTKEFDSLYKDNVRKLEITAQRHKDSILAAKDELDALEKDKEKVTTDCKKLNEDCGADIKKKQADFDRILKQETDRLEKSEKSFNAKVQNYDNLVAETKRLNLEAQAEKSEADKFISESKDIRDKLNKKIAEYEVLISETMQKNHELDKKLKTIQPQLEEIMTAKNFIAEQEQDLGDRYRVLMSKQAKLGQDLAALIDREITVTKRETMVEKRENELESREEICKKKEGALTIMRSDLEAGHQNLKQLQEEFNQSVKSKK